MTYCFCNFCWNGRIFVQRFPIEFQCQFEFIISCIYCFRFMYIVYCFFFFTCSSLAIEMHGYRWKIYCTSWEKFFSRALYCSTQWQLGSNSTIRFNTKKAEMERREFNKLLSKYRRENIFRLVYIKSNNDESTIYFGRISLTHFLEEEKKIEEFEYEKKRKEKLFLFEILINAISAPVPKENVRE